MILRLLKLAMTAWRSPLNYKISDHFNGKKFFNPTLDEQFSPGFFDIIKMLKEKRIKWPQKVKNQYSPNILVNIDDSKVTITFVNHATFLIQFPGINILTDPVWSKRASPFSWIGPKRVREPGIDFADLPKIDIILISHNHYEHLDIETLKQLNNKFYPKVIVPVGDKALIESIDIKDVQELDWWESISSKMGLEITFTPAQHSSARGLFDRDKSLWGSYFIKNASKSIYFGGDGGYSTHFNEINQRLGAPNIAILGIGAYEPRWFMKPVHMNPAEALLAHKNLGASMSIGMHFGTFQLSSEAIFQPLIDLKKALREEKIAANKFITLHEGETIIYGVGQDG